MPKTWKDIILKDKGNAKNLVIFDQHSVSKSQICSLNKLTSEVLYLILVDANTVKYANTFTFQVNFKKIYIVRNTTLDTKALMFQFQSKVLHNILYMQTTF